jgi:hypothetical protein
MDDVNALRLAFENLDKNATCALNHNGDPRPEGPIDSIVIGLGTRDVAGLYIEVAEEITIPVCASCHDSLLGDRWIIVYCTECHESAWIDRQVAEGTYGDYNIILIGGCTHCQPGVPADYIYFLKIDPQLTGG